PWVPAMRLWPATWLSCWLALLVPRGCGQLLRAVRLRVPLRAIGRRQLIEQRSTYCCRAATRCSASYFALINPAQLGKVSMVMVTIETFPNHDLSQGPG